MRVLLTIIGAIVGLSLASGPHEMFGIFLGAFAGLGAGEFGALRGKLKALEEELGALRKEMAQRPSRAGESARSQGQQPVGPESEPQHARGTDGSPPHSTSSVPTAGAWEPYGVASPPAGAMARTGAPSGWAASAAGGAPRTEGAATGSGTQAEGPAAGTEPHAEDLAAGSGSQMRSSGARRSGAEDVVAGSGPRAAAIGSGPQSGSHGARQPGAEGPADLPASGHPSAGRGRSAPPRREDFVDTAVRLLREYFTGGNTLVRVGIVILFFGVAFLLRYAAEHTHVPIEFRLSGVALGGIILLVLGWRLRTQRAGYALALQGGAVGILYLTIFAGLKIYSLLPPGAAFVLLGV